MKRCVLHVGMPKTGTTTIQLMLRRNAENLLRQGVQVPPSRFARCDELFLLTVDRYRKKRVFPIWDIYSQRDLDAIRPELEQTVRGWFQEAKADTMLLTQEGLQKQSLEDLSRLRDLLRSMCDELTIVICLRRQDLWLNSHFRNRVRNKSDKRENVGGPGPDYHANLDKLAKVFGRENVRPFVFVDSAPGNADLVQDFLSAGKLDLDTTGFEMPDAKNAAWDVRGVRILSQINQNFPSLTNGRVRRGRKMLERAIERAFQDDCVTYRMPKQQALEICEHHAEGNARVAREWFGRDRLFHEDFSKYDTEMPQPAREDYERVIIELAKVAENAVNAQRNIVKGK